MSKLSNEYPTLTQFLGGYFHQDWVDEFECPNEVLKYATSSESIDFLKKVHEELVELGCLNLDNDKNLIKLGCYYFPQSDGFTEQAWLKEVDDAIKSKIASN